jgi:thiol:disulfide interchange protein DsbD
MGFLEVAFALKFLSFTDLAWFPGNPQIFNYDTTVCAYIALSVACSLHLFGIFRLDHDDPQPAIGPIRMIFASVFLGLAVYMAPLLFGVHPKGAVMEAIEAFLPVTFDSETVRPDPSRPGTASQGSNSIWIVDDYKKAWTKAKDEKKRILIDFTGQWCLNCRLNERNVFTDPSVADGFRKYVCVKLYTDEVPDPKLQVDQRKAKAASQLAYQEGLGLAPAQPTYAIIEPDADQAFDGTNLKARLLDSRSALVEKQDFLKFLRKNVEEPAAKAAWKQEEVQRAATDVGGGRLARTRKRGSDEFSSP